MFAGVKAAHGLLRPTAQNLPLLLCLHALKGEMKVTPARILRERDGATAAELRRSGYTLEDLKEAGCSVLELTDSAGFSPLELCDAAFVDRQLDAAAGNKHAESLVALLLVAKEGVLVEGVLPQASLLRVLKVLYDLMGDGGIDSEGATKLRAELSAAGLTDVIVALIKGLISQPRVQHQAAGIVARLAYDDDGEWRKERSSERVR